MVDGDRTERFGSDIELITNARYETSKFIARLMMTYAGFAVFCVFALLSPDRLMVVGKSSLNVPIAGNVSFFGFMLVAPAVLIGMRIYLDIYVRRWRELDTALS